MRCISINADVSEILWLKEILIYGTAVIFAAISEFAKGVAAHRESLVLPPN